MNTRVLAKSSMLVLLLAFVATATVTVQAQSQRDRISVPFSFVVADKVFPAGEYTVEPNRKDSLNVWLLKTDKGNDSVVFNTISVRSAETQKQTQLVFYKYNDQYFLSQVWTAGENAGRELNISRQQQEVARNRRVEKVVITNTGN